MVILKKSVGAYLTLILLGFLSFSGSIFAYPSFSQTSDQFGAIRGRVVDKASRKPLRYVNVFIPGLGRGDVTDSRGRFFIGNLPEGNYNLVFRMQGYRTIQRKNIAIFAQKILEMNEFLQQTVIPMEEIVVTASRKEELEHEIPQLVSVVTEQEIREKNILQTPEALREEIGLFVQKTNQGGGSPILRGLRANKLLLLIDGVRMNNATYRGGNLQYLNTIDPLSLGRIEIVHGPVSSLYGSDALAGAINLITKNPLINDRPEFMLNGKVAGAVSTANQARVVHLGLTSGYSKLGMLFDFTYRSFGEIRRGSHGGAKLMQRLQNDSRTKRILPELQSPNGFESYDLTLKSTFQPSPVTNFSMVFQLSRQPSVPRYDVHEVQKYSVWNYEPQERQLIYFSLKNRKRNFFYDQAGLTLSLQRQAERRIRQKFASISEYRDSFATLTAGLQLQLNRLLWKRHILIYGFEFYHDWIDTHSERRNTLTGDFLPRNPIFPDGSTYANFGLYAQGEFSLAPRWNLHIGTRLSAFQLRAPFASSGRESLALSTVRQSPKAITASLGSKYMMSNNLSWVANIAQGFRAPNLDDATKLGPGKGGSFYDIPNPNLQPEKTLAFDTGLKWVSDRLKANVVAYYNHLTDLLVRRPAIFRGLPFVVEEMDTLLVFHKENAGRAYTTGFAMNLNWVLGRRAVLLANLSYTVGQDLSHDEPLSKIPPLNGLMGLRWRYPKGWLEANVRFAAAQERLSSEDKKDLRIPEGGTPGWFTLNLRSSFTLGDNLSLRLAISNLLDQNYREHLSGFNAPGRSFWASFEVALKP